MAPTAPAAPSESEWSALGAKLGGGIKQAGEVLQDIFDMVNNVLGHWWCPGWVADWVRPILAKLNQLSMWIINKIIELLEGFAFPLIAFFAANDWNDGVKNPVNKVAGAISDSKLTVDDNWQGKAATAYAGAVKAQTDAMTETSAIVGDLQIRLWAIGAGAAALYVAIGVILVQWIAVLVACAAADATGIGAILGIPVSVGDTAVSGGAIATAIGLFVALVGVELQSYTTLNGRITNSPKFPDGHWPKATTGAMSDSTWKDGDESDWKMK